MTASAPPLEKLAHRRERFALVCAAVWLFGTFASRYVNLWVGVGGAALLLAGLTLLRERELLRSLFAPTPARILLGAVGGLAQIAVTYTLYPVLSGVWPWLAHATRELYVILGATNTLGPLVIIPLVIVSEEVVWRGVVQETFSARCAPFVCAMVTAFIYGFCHFPTHPLLPVLALLCGLYWGAWRALTGSLLTPLIAHLLWDLCVFILAPLVRV